MALTFEASTKLVARSLHVTGAQLQAGLRPATLADLAPVVAFRREHLGTVVDWDDTAYLSWRYRLGRPGCGFGDLWVLHGTDGPLAILGVEELPVRLGDQALVGARVMDLLARADIQETGIGAWLNQAIFREHDFALAMGANQNSTGIVKRLYQPLKSRQTRTHPIDLRPYVTRKVRGPALAATISAAGTVGMGAWRTWRQLSRSSTVRLARIERFDDSLLPQTPAAPQRLHVIRTADYLNRRLLDNPRRSFEAIAAFRGDRAAGYVAWMIDQHGEGGDLSELNIVDWQASDAAALGHLLMGTVAQARAGGCACVRLRLQDEATQEVARRHGFLRLNKTASKMVGVHAADATLLATLTAAEWALTDVSDDTDGY